MKLNNKGETLVEALCSLLILSLLMFAFPNLLVRANELNDTVKNQDISYKADESVKVKVDVFIREENKSFDHGYNNVKGYIDNGFYYYKY